MGGVSPSSNHSDLFEQWNGSAWTETTEFNTGRAQLGGAGVNTATLIYGGNKSGPTDTGETEYWDGSSWTEVADLTTTRKGLSGGGTYNSALAVAGDHAGPGTLDYSTLTESWNNTAWTEAADLSTGRNSGASDGPSNLVNLAFGGYDGSSNVSSTEEWTFSGIQPTDPAADYADAITGDFYYNSTTGQFKTVNTGGAPIGSWSWVEI